MTSDPHATLRDEVFDRVLTGPGHTDPSLRQAAANGSGLPADLQPFVEKIHAHAYRVTDADVSRLRTSYDDDELFELVVSAAVGASRERLLAGLRALEGATARS
jgi:hypothetical protein